MFKKTALFSHDGFPKALLTNGDMVVLVLLVMLSSDFNQFVMIWMIKMNLIRMFAVHKCVNA